ncbi:hypothetical protein GGX14DRAFT_442533 [Mycena pura]|uniref:Zn(2)-C6 fungal-type domain-containing protein n=1 Tax=Mycena pura TaxID=153505 RepID=A0AAD6VTY7_9AGAR|nr:hypothetical protein GGX14DRAFT_442533 [Mycena pura]
MSSSYSHYSPAQHHAPQRRRTTITCLSCRQNNLTCKPSEQSPHIPCARCVRKNLICQYVSVAEDDAPQTSSKPATRPPSSSSGYYPVPNAVPALPYTSAPPMNSRPRYSGGNTYPDLSLAGAHPSRPPAPTQHHPSQYMPSSRHDPQLSGHRPSNAWPASAQSPWPSMPTRPDVASQYQNPATHTQSFAPMPFFADTSMPEQQQYEWSGYGG